MKEISVDHIDIGEDRFPMYCDLRVLEKLQDRFETISKFERELLGQELVYDDDGNPLRDGNGTIEKKQTEPSVKAIVAGLYLMIEEGQRMEAKQGIESEPISEDDIYELCEGNTFLLSRIVHTIFMKSFTTKKNEDGTKTSRKTKK